MAAAAVGAAVIAGADVATRAEAALDLESDAGEVAEGEVADEDELAPREADVPLGPRVGMGSVAGDLVPLAPAAPLPVPAAPFNQAALAGTAGLLECTLVGTAVLADSEPVGAGRSLRAIDLAPFALAALLLVVLLRPLRRVLHLAHLRRPFWPESADQRVANLWSLASIGLRDAGWYAATGEGPMAFARRTGSRDVEACALVLERSRHGLGAHADDVARMEEAAARAYAAARAPLGLATRALTWFRWPLLPHRSRRPPAR